jgi:iron complex outermembrane receptor protein
VYANFDVRALRRFSFSVGAREQAYGGLRMNFNPTVSAGFWLSSKFKLRASAGRAFRLPTYTDLYYTDPITVGNPNLKPELAWSYDGGLDWNSGGRLSGGVTVFDRRLSNGIDYALAADGLWHATNIDDLNFRGVETALRLRLPNQQQLDFAYTGINANRDSSMGNVPTRYLFNYLADDGSIGWQGRLPGNIMGRTRLGTYERRGLDPYALWDMSLTRAFGRVSPFLQLSNLTNTQYADITVPARVLMPGRSVVGGVNVRIASRGK